MKTIKIIDLLNKIAKGEEVPERIKYCNEVFIFNKDNCNFLYKYQIGKCQLFGCCRLNDEVEIIEENKIPEKINLKLDDWTTPSQCDIELSKKIDEIIDYLESKEKENENE